MGGTEDGDERTRRRTASARARLNPPPGPTAASDWLLAGFSVALTNTSRASPIRTSGLSPRCACQLTNCGRKARLCGVFWRNSLAKASFEVVVVRFARRMGCGPRPIYVQDDDDGPAQQGFQGTAANYGVCLPAWLCAGESIIYLYFLKSIPSYWTRCVDNKRSSWEFSSMFTPELDRW